MKSKEGCGRTMRKGRQETRLLESAKTERWYLAGRAESQGNENLSKLRKLEISALR